MSLGRIFANIKTIVTKNKLATILISLGVFFRFFKLSEFAMFLGDQGRDAIIVKRIVSFEHFPAIGPPSSVGQVFLGPFYYYLMAPFLAIFRLDPAGLAFGVALISSLGLIVSYQIVKKIFDRKTGLIFLTLLTFSYVNIAFSRFSWNPNLLPLISFFTLYFFYKLFSEKNNWYAFLSGAFLSLSIQLHHLAFFLILPSAAMYLKLTFLNKSKIAPLIKKSLLSLVGFFLIWSPLIIFDLKHQFLNTNNLIKLFTTPNFVSKMSYFSRLLETSQSFFLNIFQSTLNAQVTFLLLLLLLIVCFVIKPKKNESVFLQLHIFNLIFFILAFSLLGTQRLAHYYGIIYYSFFVVLAYFLSFLINQSKIGVLILFIFLGLYIFSNFQNYYFFYNAPENQIEKAKRIAQTIIDKKPQTPYQVVALPFTETDGHIRYFLEILGATPLPEDSNAQPLQLYILCHAKKCDALGDPQWQIAAFRDKKIDTIWQAGGEITIYKIVHER